MKYFENTSYNLAERHQNEPKGWVLKQVLYAKTPENCCQTKRSQTSKEFSADFYHYLTSLDRNCRGDIFCRSIFNRRNHYIFSCCLLCFIFYFLNNFYEFQKRFINSRRLCPIFNSPLFRSRKLAQFPFDYGNLFNNRNLLFKKIISRWNLLNLKTIDAELKRLQNDVK